MPRDSFIQSAMFVRHSSYANYTQVMTIRHRKAGSYAGACSTCLQQCLQTLDSINERRRALPEHTYDISKLSDKEYIAEMSLVSLNRRGNLCRVQSLASTSSPPNHSAPHALPSTRLHPSLQRNIRAPTLTFVKLVPDPSRTQDDVEVLARKWTELFRSGQVPVNFYAASSQQIIALVEDGETALMAKKFFLEQPEVYEWEVEVSYCVVPSPSLWQRR